METTIQGLGPNSRLCLEQAVLSELSSLRATRCILEDTWSCLGHEL